MAHDFNRFPELTNAEMDLYYFESPHKQITENITAKCVKVHDGDTISIRWQHRNFDFPVRFADIQAPELSEEHGKESQSWLEKKLLNEEVDIILSKQRVEKWGRLLAKIYHMGQNVGDEAIFMGKAKGWEARTEGQIRDEIKLPKEMA